MTNACQEPAQPRWAVQRQPWRKNLETDAVTCEFGSVASPVLG